ncbi:DNA-binding protein HU-beta [Dysgonomonas sp. PFB1-18]|uniref:HU family DNA-binding protein n=1 Tax=unclassified Dysgonomonas TaxID=2630389 RepID=UPI0024733EF0|nr:MULTISPECIES: HU family DNA-binding protein [unclassified Dysgonomonas]MDL2303442.1 HU family DNA-binding protein [Dysgonomonas sp. OttesenSCG-928-D17]MDH6309846.1 DNA-binding protein HU-beta [Dysgonomonas sp. PF1-14]MDH6339390.1 DNA-binding protein HU-beta [Dysgonomonas sp. PF1-16]MDH6380889.1 DNA-binding protein HU-beta [Dysgonomonas sp. PFB1-18]MDH6397898.1 DNA-binding protein HU-beta [Dysgonomonas sp. PF1-23]
MTNQELIAALAKRMGWTQKQTSEVLESAVSIINNNLEESNSVNIQGFGLFETKKKGERISVNPVSKQRFLVPPKISLAFRPGQTIKDNLKKLEVNE